ncbi:Ger(x)C family spore germination protein [Paenibacillus arenilitoris]|uniref:Ger(X)C family spore germination protein n=1 Tax=Paenibacillus arenilitoris TaxID=2772299 RepID=A0A927CLV1_9BACL|nr:Ger(x)C family spore germination protein [Paenibacillus arenilitoris]MBD2870478.1 Ger(x)C family spore germination protein [Paenibacillus arenilitoris]
MTAVKTARSAVVLAFFALLLTGCWDRIELNELAITSATSVDRDGEDWVVSFQVVIPSTISSGIGIMGAGSSSAPVIVYSTKGKSIREANSRSYLESPRKLYFAHNRIIVISEETARRGLDPILDVYLRNPDARETVDVLITRGNARKVLEQMMQIERIPGNGIREINNMEEKYLSTLPEVKLYELAMSLSSDSAGALLPEVYLSGKTETDSLKAFEKTTLPSKLRLGRIAVINKDKMVGWLSRQEGLGVAFIRNTVDMTMIAPACPDDPSKQASVSIGSSTTELKPAIRDGKLSVKVQIKASGSLTQIDCGIKDLNDPATVAALEQAAEKEIVKLADSGWKAVRRLKTDAVGFADLAHRKYRKQWRKWKKDWDSVFANIQVEIAADVTLTNVGLSKEPIQVERLKEGKK